MKVKELIDKSKAKKALITLKLVKSSDKYSDFLLF